MKNRTRKRFKPLAVQTSTVKKSAATINSQCCVRNSFQLAFRLAEALVRFRAGAEYQRWCCALTYSQIATLHPGFDDSPRFGFLPPFE